MPTLIVEQGFAQVQSYDSNAQGRFYALGYQMDTTGLEPVTPTMST